MSFLVPRGMVQGPLNTTLSPAAAALQPVQARQSQSEPQEAHAWGSGSASVGRPS